MNNRRLKLIDGEIWSWKPTKNPYWRKIKYSVDKDGYYFIQLTHNYKKKCYFVHRVIYKLNNTDWDIHDVSSTNQIDHFDNNKSNNNIENLRVVTHSENKQNTITTKGYCWSTRDKTYYAQIMINYKRHTLGCYDTPEEAREAYLIGKKKYHIECCL